ncbi:MAG TPA: hypothetical protein VKQ52_14135 [Puia sp.]|nr:hypothetical protein [Puia sp.]
MNGKNDISEELRLLSELIATISRETPYRVADDYFPDLAARVLLRVKTQHKPLAFNVPDGYFDGFAEGVLARIKSGAGKASGPGKPVPEGVEAELASLSPLLAQLRQAETYRIPEGYFEEISPILAVAKNKNPYTVPEEYFHRLPVEIEEKVLEPVTVEEEEQARVITLGAHRSNWWKYSAAAVVAGLIFTVGWLRLYVPGGHRTTSPDIVAASLPRVSDQDLQRFLADQDTTLAQPTSNLAMQDFSENDLKTLLGDVPDGELKQYMEEHGGANDIATN